MDTTYGHSLGTLKNMIGYLQTFMDTQGKTKVLFLVMGGGEVENCYRLSKKKGIYKQSEYNL